MGYKQTIVCLWRRLFGRRPRTHAFADFERAVMLVEDVERAATLAFARMPDDWQMGPAGADYLERTRALRALVGEMRAWELPEIESGGGT